MKLWYLAGRIISVENHTKKRFKIVRKPQGYNLDTPSLKTYKQRTKLYQNDTILQEKAI